MADPEIAGNILQILARLPEFLRKPMLRNRLNDFFTLPDAERRQTIASALNAVPTTEFAVLSDLIKTWLEVLCEFDEEKCMVMLGFYVDVLADSPDIMKKLNVDGLLSIFNTMPEDSRHTLSGSLQNLVQALAREKKTRFLSIVPENAKKALCL